MTKQAPDTGVLSPWLKPGALVPGPEADAEEDVVKALTGRRRVTYRRAMAEMGIEPGDKRHNHSLDWAMMWLRENRPFYAYCFVEIVRREAYEISTLAVTCRRGRVELLYNPDFLAIHGLRHNVGFLQHELGHVIHGHVSDGQKRPELYRDRLVNVAMDLAVDSLIQGDGDQPAWVLMPSKLRIPEPGVPEDAWSNFPERATWERYYELLKQMRDQCPEYFQQHVVIRAGAPSDDEGNRQAGDDHGLWQSAEDCDHPDVVDEVVRHLVRQAMETTESKNPGRGRGMVPGGVMELVDELLGRAAVPFTRLFRAFVASRFDVRRRVAVNRVSRRRATIPGSRASKRLRVLWCRDTSGSVGSEELAVSYNELYEMRRQTGVSVAVQDFDHGLQGPVMDLDTVPVARAAAFRGRGGTEFSEPLRLAAEMRPDVCVITTDGYAPFPNPPPGVPVMWLITHDGAQPPWGTVVRLPNKKEIASGHKATVERWLGKQGGGSPPGD